MNPQVACNSRRSAESQSVRKCGRRTRTGVKHDAEPSRHRQNASQWTPAMKSGAAIVAAFAFAATAAQAATTDLVVHCAPPLAGPLRDIAVAFQARSGVRLRLFPTAPN